MAEWLCLLRPVSPGVPHAMTAAERDSWGRHAERLAADVRHGPLVLAGPSTGTPTFGVLVFEAPDEDAAWAYVNADPTVAEGHQTAELYPFRTSFLRGRPVG